MNAEELQWLQQYTAYCKTFRAYITKEQCKINKSNAKNRQIYDDTINTGLLKTCLYCTGVFGDLKVNKNETSYPDKKKCSRCESWKDIETEFKLTSKGNVKNICEKCSSYNARLKQAKRNPLRKFPMLQCRDDCKSALNTEAVTRFNLKKTPYGRAYKHDNEYFIEFSDKKHENFSTYTIDKGSLHTLRSSARAIINALETYGRNVKFIMHATDDPLVFKLEEVEDQ